ncbi:MAG: cytochrome P450, partial [Halioglobus sp.]|nr:cytochrome P450 [Halioglobus sp.]
MNLAKRTSEQAPGPDEPVSIDVNAATLPRLLDMQARYGNIVSFEKSNKRRGVFINDPAAVRTLLVRHHQKYRKGPGFERVEMLLGNGLIVSDGDVWRRSRTMIQPAFSRQNVHQLTNLMIDCTRQKARAWRRAVANGETLNVTREMNDFALVLILRAIFGDDYETRILNGGENPFTFLSKDTSPDLSVVIKLRKLRELLLEIIDSRRTRKTGSNFDFLAKYMLAVDKQGQPFSDRELLDELMTLIVAGYETSAGTLNWAWYLLAHHPEVMEKLRAEAETYGSEMSRASEDPALEGMTWTQQVLDETLRLYPPVWLFSRSALEDDALDGYVIPRDADIYLSPFIMQRTAEFWANPETFSPERFGRDGPYTKGDRPYIPFSLGPRRCLGEYFSFLEMKIHLGM